MYVDCAEIGENQLFKCDGTWYLHVTAIRDVEDQSAASTDEWTPTGVDIGEASLITVCPRDESGSPVRLRLWADDGKTRPSAPQDLPHRQETAAKAWQ